MKPRAAGPASPFLRIPPFPNPARQKLTLASGQDESLPSQREIDEFIELIAELRVGGTYWGEQPRLPVSPYVLVRVRDRRTRSEIMKSIDDDRAVLLWLGSGRPAAKIDSDRITVVRGNCDPWHLLRGAEEVIVDSDDELAVIAAISDLPVRCAGAGPFEAIDQGRTGLRRIMSGPLLGSRRYADPFTGKPICIKDAIELCSFWRRLIDGNRSIQAALGFASWKRSAVAPLLWSGSDGVRFQANTRGLKEGDQVVVWKSRLTAATVRDLAYKRIHPIEVEDGFIRSVGLGADCVPPLSIVVDRMGIYFDPQRSSDLEAVLQEGSFSDELLQRARRLRELIVKSGISKYDVGGTSPRTGTSRRQKILVIGQVEDDRSVRCGGGDVQSNLELLRRVRRNAADSYIYYRPHPDVQAGHRIGRIADEKLVGLADEVVSAGSISEWIDSVDEVHVNTSLAGFEALLRGKPVTTYGVPFYAGWGLTNDLGDVPSRRSAKRELDELVAAALLIYPRYLDPQTGLPCPPEILVARLAEGGAVQSKGPLVRFRQMQGRWKRLISSLRSE